MDAGGRRRIFGDYLLWNGLMYYIMGLNDITFKIRE